MKKHGQADRDGHDRTAAAASGNRTRSWELWLGRTRYARWVRVQGCRLPRMPRPSDRGSSGTEAITRPLRCGSPTDFETGMQRWSSIYHLV